MPKKSAKKKLRKLHPFLSVGILLLVSTFIGIIALLLPRGSDCANAITCISDLSGTYTTVTSGEFLGKVVDVPEEKIEATNLRVLGNTTSSHKRIEVDLTNQKLYAFEENKVIYEFPISSGKWGKTPTGTFRIWVKLRYTRMSGGDKSLGTYYDLPNVPYTMFFYNKDIPKSRGYGIHGAYWHNNFGNPMSHGCINMRTEDVEKIYHWASPASTAHMTYANEEDPGTLIKIYGQARNY
jgi:hypothetical protein